MLTTTGKVTGYRVKSSPIFIAALRKKVMSFYRISTFLNWTCLFFFPLGIQVNMFVQSVSYFKVYRRLFITCLQMEKNSHLILNFNCLFAQTEPPLTTRLMGM